MLSAQAPIPGPQELDQLLAPVALYPDSLLAQITTASTNPQEVLDVDNWLQAHPGLAGSALTDAAEREGFDPAFIALTNFPQVLEMMAENIDDFAAIGEAFSADQGAVSASIQRLRDQAYAAGTLRSSPEQQVLVQQPAGQTVYVIQPASPQVVYVPVYNPTLVYARPRTVISAPLITFTVGIAIGALLVDNRPWGWGGWGWNWGARRAFYNHAIWAGWGNPYRPPNIWYRPRPIRYTSRPGYGGNWHYRPPNYRPPVPVNRPGNRPPWGPGNKPGTRPPGNQPGVGRPPAPQPRPGTTRPAVRPPTQTRPTRPPANDQNRPGLTRPAPQPRPQPNRPAVTRPQPGLQPSQPRPQPKPAVPNRPAVTRPAPQPKPARPNQPKPQTKPEAPPKQPGQTRPAPKPKDAPPNGV